MSKMYLLPILTLGQIFYVSVFIAQIPELLEFAFHFFYTIKHRISSELNLADELNCLLATVWNLLIFTFRAQCV